MKKIKLSKDITFIYEKVPGDITSFTIGFEAGANRENKNNLGLAHATEHMVFKGTLNRSEREINDLCNEYLGFHNAMTNYPYVVYYGSCLKEDFTKAFNTYFDVVFNPAFKEEGFKEEINVIIEELKEWGDDVVQHCEDMLFFNAFKERRIKELIIGREDTIKALTLEDIKKFHRTYYRPENCIISVVTSLEFCEVIKIIEEEIGKIQYKPESKALIELEENPGENKDKLISLKDKGMPLYENPEPGIYEEENSTISGCKLQYIFPIHQLSEKESALLHLFNEYFASGTSSLLYDEIRTNRGLVYDIQGKIKNEKGIKLYTITLSTSKENLEEVQEIIWNKIEEVKKSTRIFTKEFFGKYIKSQKRKRMLSLEKSIVMSMHLVIYEIMHHGGAELLLDEFSSLNNCTEKDMLTLINKVFANKTIGIIRN